MECLDDRVYCALCGPCPSPCVVRVRPLADVTGPLTYLLGYSGRLRCGGGQGGGRGTTRSQSISAARRVRSGVCSSAVVPSRHS
jgi:hypothetical protein